MSGAIATKNLPPPQPGRNPVWPLDTQRGLDLLGSREFAVGTWGCADEAFGVDRIDGPGVPSHP